MLKHIFDMPRPNRLVIDATGREPRYSWQLDGHSAVKSVRVDARNRGTRVVVDLVEGQLLSYKPDFPPRLALAKR
jgi:phosphoribosylamine-glycine ligase